MLVMPGPKAHELLGRDSGWILEIKDQGPWIYGVVLLSYSMGKESHTSIRPSNEHPRHSSIKPLPNIPDTSPSDLYRAFQTVLHQHLHWASQALLSRPSNKHPDILPSDPPEMCSEFLEKDHGMNFITKLSFHVLFPLLSLNNYFKRLINYLRGLLWSEGKTLILML